jgi:hypothetical protein
MLRWYGYSGVEPPVFSLLHSLCNHFSRFFEEWLEFLFDAQTLAGQKYFFNKMRFGEPAQLQSGGDMVKQRLLFEIG